jgi:TonB family protein
MARMSKLKCAVAAALLVSTLWAQAPAPPAANPAASAPPASQSQPPDASAPAASNPSPAPTPPPDSTRLELIKKVKPDYPPAAAPDKLQGQVIVRIVVNEAGDVDSAEVISGNPVLAAAAVDAVKQWKFKPFIKNGQPVKAAVKLPFDFAPPEEPPTVDASIPSQKSDVPAASPEKPKQVRVASGVIQGMLLHRVEPTYPRYALQSRLQGTVILKAVISKRGNDRGPPGY